MAKQKVIVYWLIPAAEYRELFVALINILAAEFDTPRFEPHLTLCRGRDAKALRRVRAGSVRLRVREVSHSSKFTKTLFVRFWWNAALKDLIAELGGKPRSLRDPHISFLYKRVAGGLRRQLAATIRLPFREVVFDSIKAVQCPSPTRTRADVESWRVIATKRLSG
jgi:hypothetical protein